MSKQIIKFFTDIVKVDDEKRIVSGYASTSAIDCQGDVIPNDAMVKAMPEYMKYANIREMHKDDSAVGVVLTYKVDDVGTYIEVEVVDDAAWKKVKKGVYKGFSIGGAVIKKIGNVITDLMLIEISLVDRPANPLALITEFKSDNLDSLPEELQVFAKSYSDKIPEAEILPEENKEDKLKDLEKSLSESGISLEEIIEAIAKSKKEKEDKEAEEISKKQEALLEKGFYDVQDVLSAINALNWVLDSQEWEAKWENDANPEILTSIREHILSLVELAKKLMDNEIKDIQSESTEIIELSNKMNEMKLYADSLPKVEKSQKEDEVLIFQEKLTKSLTANEDLSKSLTEKDEEIHRLKEIIKSATFESKPNKETTTIVKSINSDENTFNNSLEYVESRISEINEKLTKCSDKERKELTNELAGLKVRKSQLASFKK